MKQSIRNYGPVALLMAGIVGLSAVITVLGGVQTPASETLTVMTTVSPLYEAVQLVVGDTDVVRIQTLTGTASAGCLHEYQLSPADRLAAERADLLVLNGAGAEPFLDEIVAALPTEKVVDTSRGISLLCAAEEHDHEEHAHHHEEGGYNEHIWTSPVRYAAQIQAVTQALCALDPAHAQTYRANGEAYRGKVLAIGERLRRAAEALPSRRCVVFHPSLLYLAEDLGLQVELSLAGGEQAGLSAGELAAVRTLGAQEPGLLLLYDAQYAVRYTGVDAGVSPAQVLSVDTGVSGNWLVAMENTALLFERIQEGQT
ncbi:MAG: zinc ABC transporter substrate-binding protein [Clostridia bacterium]|nr:zinc ABC transporter substrate-binding protein [Loktanella sp.]MBQ1950080.1 zinc ABC transporter substrate-binding protein [Clostridia bacterium]